MRWNANFQLTLLGAGILFFAILLLYSVLTPRWSGRTYIALPVAVTFLLCLALGCLVASEKARRSLMESEEQYRELCESANDLIDVVAANGTILHVNPAWRQTLGYSSDEVPHLSLQDLVHPDDQEHVKEDIDRLLAGGPARRFEVRLLRKDGSAIQLEGSESCRRTQGKPPVIHGIHRDITERKQAEQRVQGLHQRLQAALVKEQEISRIDPLTHVYNRRAFFELADIELTRARRYSRPVSIAYIDLDDFKRVNDTLGHNSGDAVLVTVASTVRIQLRATDIVARMGGDEFAVMLPETNAESARIVLEKLQRKLAEAFQSNEWQVTCSIGAASFLETPGSLEDAIRLADETMYSIKKQGKNKLSVTLMG